MIFCGDLVHPESFCPTDLIQDESQFWNESKFINLESSIRLGTYIKQTKGIALQSSPGVADFLKEISSTCVSFANNHFFECAKICITYLHNHHKPGYYQ